MSLISFKIIFQCFLADKLFSARCKPGVTDALLSAIYRRGSLKRNERVSDQNPIFFWREKLDVWRESV